MNSNKRGLLAVLFATAVGGGLGYLVQILVPVWMQGSADYLQFSVFWSTTFLLVSMLSGLQQEVSRAVRPVTEGEHVPTRLTHGTKRTSTQTLFGAAGVVALVTLIAVPASSPAWVAALFPEHSIPFIGAMTLALVGYVFIATLSGQFYGLGSFEWAAATTILDAGLRAACVIGVLLLGLGLVPVAYGVAVPFGVAALIIWSFSGRRFSGKYYVDVALGKLLKNSAQAMLAALATGVLISGLPTMLRLTSFDLGDHALASLILALTLTRAPIVIPLLALQSYLIVGYRNAPQTAGMRAIKLALGVLTLAALLAVLAGFIGPTVMQAVYGPERTLAGTHLALVVFSGGVTAMLCVVAPALLAQGKHALFLISWVMSAVATILFLLFTPHTLLATVLSIAAGPLLGSIFCISVLLFLRRANPSASTDPLTDAEAEGRPF